MSKKVELKPRSPQEMEALYVKLLEFLMNNPDYQYAETSDGIIVVISNLKVVEKSVIAKLPEAK